MNLNTYVVPGAGLSLAIAGRLLQANADGSFTAVDPLTEIALARTGYRQSSASLDASGALTGADGLPPASALTPSLKGPKATYLISTNSNGGLVFANARPPVMWQGSQGFAGFLSNTVIKGVGYGLGTKTYAIGTADQNFYVHDTSNSNGWVKKTAAAINGGQGILNTMWTSLAGVHFLSWAPNAAVGAQNLYRSTDDGTTWTKVITSSVLTAANDYIGSIDEDGMGTTMCTAYNGVDPAGTATKGLFLSTDGGATWANIYARLPINYARHVHTVMYDPYRKTWWVSGGDGSATNICYSTDGGATWQAWAKSFQATTMFATETAFIFQADISGYHDIIRIPADMSLGAAGVVAQDPRSHVAFKLGLKRNPVAPVAGLAGDEFSFIAFRDRNGVIYFPIGKSATGRAAYLVSADDGATWSDALGGTSSTQSAAAQASVTIFGWEPILPSKRRSDWDGWIYGYPNASTYVTRRFRMLPPNAMLYVDPVNGDDVHGDGSAQFPLKSLDHPNLPSGTHLTLLGNISGRVVLPQNGIVIHRNGYQLGSPDAGGTLTVNETFEGTSSLLSTVNATTGTVDQANTSNPYVDPYLNAGGTRHARLAAVANNDNAILYANNALTGVTDGTVVTMSARLSFNFASIAAVLSFMQLQGGLVVGVQATSSGGALQVTTSSDGRIYQQHVLDRTAMPLQGYFECKIEVLKHATQGWVKVWQITQDGPTKVMKLALYVRDVNTSGSGWTSARVGFISGAQAGQQMDVDNVKLALGFDCDYQPGYVLAGDGSWVLPDMAHA